MFNGPVNITYSDGCSYSGDSHEGVEQGNGVLICPAFTFTGEFLKGSPNGKGFLNFTNGDHYEG